MAHNFRELSGLTPLKYIAKSGHDSNNGLTPDTPKKSITTLNTTQIGAGYYEVTGDVFDFSFSRGDGKVILDFKGNKISSNFYENLDIEIRNMVGFFFGSSTQTQLINKRLILKDCQGSFSPGGNRNLHIEESQFINCNIISSGSTRYPYLNYNVFYNSTFVLNGASIQYTFMSESCTIDITDASGPVNITNSNIRCPLNFAGALFTDGLKKSYAIQDLMTGTPQDNGYAAGVKWLTAANFTADGGTVTTPVQAMIDANINRDPLFNNAPLYDFSLQAGSPHIKVPKNIGGTFPAISIYNTSNGTSQISASAEIDTTNPNSYTVLSGFNEGYIDYIEKVGSSILTLKEIDPITSLDFNSDLPGGTLGNKDVPDSEPLSIEYPRKLTTTSAALNASTLNVVGHDAAVGEFVRAVGEDREIISITADTITLDAALRAIAPTNTTFQIGQKVRIGALKPNRLTFMLRTSKLDNPSLDSDWDNDIDPVYNKAGDFLTQEWGQVPGYYIDTIGNAVWGSGDSETPPGLSKNEIACKWVHIRVYIRNNYES